MSVDDFDFNAAVLRVLQHLFVRHYGPTLDVPPSERWRAPPGHFIAWLAEVPSVLDAGEAAAHLGVTAEAWEAAVGLSPEALRVLSDNWYSVAMADRRPPEQQLVAATLTCCLRWRDGTLSASGRYAPFDPDGPFPADGATASVLGVAFANLVSELGTRGLDRLYEDSAGTRLTLPEGATGAEGRPLPDPFEVFKALIFTQIADLPEALRGPVANYGRLAVQHLRPDLVGRPPG